MTDEHVERRARAIDDATGNILHWDNVILPAARATFAADRSAGYVLVPEKATEEMAEAYYSVEWGRQNWSARLNVAIAAGAVGED